jgi:hypothetical protein
MKMESVRVCNHCGFQGIPHITLVEKYQESNWLLVIFLLILFLPLGLLVLIFGGTTKTIQVPRCQECGGTDLIYTQKYMELSQEVQTDLKRQQAESNWKLLKHGMIVFAVFVFIVCSIGIPVYLLDEANAKAKAEIENELEVDKKKIGELQVELNQATENGWENLKADYTTKIITLKSNYNKKAKEIGVNGFRP